MAKSSGGRTFLLIMLVAVGIGLFIRFKCRASKGAAPAKPPAVVADAGVADAAVVEVAADAAPIEEPEVVRKPIEDDGPGFVLSALSADRSRALFVTLQGTPHLRVVAIDTGVVETEVKLPALESIEDPASEAVMGDLMRARAVLREFPLGTHRFSTIAASSDGTRGAFNDGDSLYLVAGDKLGARVALPAAYDPMVTPDGTLVMRGYDGRIDGEGKYSLFTMPVTGGKPKKIAGTDGLIGKWAVSKSNTLRVIVSHAPAIPACVLDVSLTKPYRVLSKACPDQPLDGEIDLSPSGDWIVWASEGEGGRRIRSMELATKRIDLDTEHEGNMSINDEGRVVIATAGESTVWEPKRKELRESAWSFDNACEWRNANEMVCPDGGKLRVVAP